ncbi:MAG: DUF5011 domain-containing protein [Ruminococcus sp.]|nr:DUF5011 domain-containing protein [Ruminococcus sp.]
MKRIKSITALLIALVMMITLCSCKVSLPYPEDISSADEALAMGFSKGSYDDELAVGEYAFFGVIIKIDYEYAVQWTSSNPSVAVVDSNGRVDALSPGQTVISAHANSARIDYELTVTEAQKKEVSMSTAIIGNQSKVELNFSSESMNTPYAIFVNTKTCCVTVYTYNDKGIYNIPVRAMACSVGGDTKDAETSCYLKDTKHRWYKDSDGRFHQYATEVDDVYFCSAPYTNQAAATLVTEDYNALGTESSDNNIWMSVADAKWIYDNCGENTQVKFAYTDDYDPLGVPDSLELTKNSPSLTWDPTDDADENPYKDRGPRFEGVDDAYVIVNSTFDVYAGVKAYDTCGAELEDSFDVDGAVPCNKEGRYIISYKCTDNLKRTTRVDRVIYVVTQEEYNEVMAG